MWNAGGQVLYLLCETASTVSPGASAAAGTGVSFIEAPSLALGDEETLGANGITSKSTLVLGSIHDAKYHDGDGANRGFSRRRGAAFSLKSLLLWRLFWFTLQVLIFGSGLFAGAETMMRRHKVMDAVLRGWVSVGATMTVVKARLDPDRTSESVFESFVQDQLAVRV